MDGEAVNPRARATDPVTSHEAAQASFTFSASHKAKIYAALCESGGGTIHEIAARTGLDFVSVARRMPELVRDGFAAVWEGAAYRKSPSGNRCTVYRAVRS